MYAFTLSLVPSLKEKMGLPCTDLYFSFKGIIIVAHNVSALYASCYKITKSQSSNNFFSFFFLSFGWSLRYSLSMKLLLKRTSPTTKTFIGLMSLWGQNFSAQGKELSLLNLTLYGTSKKNWTLSCQMVRNRKWKKYVARPNMVGTWRSWGIWVVV